MRWWRGVPSQALPPHSPLRKGFEYENFENLYAKSGRSAALAGVPLEVHRGHILEVAVFEKMKGFAKRVPNIDRERLSDSGEFNCLRQFLDQAEIGAPQPAI